MQTATIQITRGSEAFAMSRKLKVFIDETYVGDIRWNESVDFPASAGEHVLYVKMDWCRSAPTKVKVADNEIVEYEVTVPPGGES